MTLRTRVLAIGTIAALSLGGSVVAIAPAQAASTTAVSDSHLVSCLTDELDSIPLVGPLLALVGGVVDSLLGHLTTLDCSGDAISSLAGLQGATNLKILDLDGNSILDLSPLQNLSISTLSALGETLTLAPVTTGVAQAIPVITNVNGTVILPTISTASGLATGVIDPVARTVTWTSNGVGQLVFSAGQFSGTITTLVTSLTNPAYPTQTPVISGSALVGATLSVNGDSSTTFQWKKDGTAIPAATGATYVPVVGDIGSSLSVVATGAATGYHSSALTSASTAPVDVAAPIPTVSGAASVGAILSLDPGAWSPGLTLTYQWKRSTSRSPHSIPGATGATYTPTSADVGLTITAWVTGSVGDKVYVKSSLPTAAIAAAVVPAMPAADSAVFAPTVTAITPTISSAVGTSALKHFARTPAPKIVGKARVDAKLSVKVGSWTKGVTFTYRWKSNGKAIARATHKTFVVAKRYAGKKITVSITARLKGYAVSTRTSTSTQRVLN